MDIYERNSIYLDTIANMPGTIWYSQNKVVYKDDTIKVREFRKGDNGANPIVFIGPNAGHGSDIYDFAKGQSLIETFKFSNENRGVYGMEWLSCLHKNRKHDINDIVCQIEIAINIAIKNSNADKVILVGLCMGGWVSAIATYFNQDKVEKLIVAGSPLNTSVERNKSVVCTMVDLYPQWYYEFLVSLGNGRMLGKYMLMGWKMNDPFRKYVQNHFDLFNAIGSKQFEKVKRFHYWFEDDKHDLAGRWYLQAVDHIFRKNDLWEQRLNVGGVIVRLQEMSVPTLSLGSYGDNITPNSQAISWDNDHIVLGNCGHIGIFMGTKSQKVWAEIFSSL